MEVSLEQVWPEWEIEGSLGSGGYGKVYKAVRRDTGAKAAIKIVSIPKDQFEIQRMTDCGKSVDEIKQELQVKADSVINEIKVMQRLKGANNIVAIEDSVMKEKSNGLGFDIFIRMELLIPLKTHFSRKHITPEDVIKLGCDICSALEVCHKSMPEKRAIIHRDIKPDNILYHKISDSYKVGDFGISRELSNEDSDCTRGTGTANFMAPEVALLKEYDTRADLYSLGLVLYYLLNDQKMPFIAHDTMPVPRESEIALRKRIAGAKLDPPIHSYPQLTAVILKACAYSPADRYSSATEMKSALQRVNASESVSKNPTEAVTSQASAEEIGILGPKPKKHKGIMTAGILALSILAIVLGAKLVLPDITNLFFGHSYVENELSGETSQDIMIDVNKSNDNISDNPTQFGIENDSNITGNDNNTTATNAGENNNKSQKTLESDPITSSAISETENEKVIQPNHTRNNAWEIEFSHPQSGELNRDTANWYKFVTSNNNSVYRIDITRSVEYTHISMPYMYIAIYNNIGIKLYEFMLFTEDKYDFIDLYLESNTEYFIKIYLGSRFQSGDYPGKYNVCVSEMLCDTGKDKNSATDLLINTRNTAIINSTLSNWHVFRVTESGKYRITLHNIDVGCNINISVELPSRSGGGANVANEDNYSWTINVNEGDSVYFEIYSYNKNPIANGQYILTIEKEEKR